MIRKLFVVSATALMLMAAPHSASAVTMAPEVTSKAPVSKAAPDGSYKIAKKKRNRRRRGNRGRDLGIGLAIGAGALALGAGIAAARDREEYGSCRRVERRCARRHGWETRRWYRCVENRDC